MSANSLRSLPIVERIKLVEDIWDSIAADQSILPITNEQKAELDLRLDAYEADDIKGREIKEAIANIKKQI